MCEAIFRSMRWPNAFTCRRAILRGDSSKYSEEHRRRLSKICDSMKRAAV
jgi:hypothetical protein